MFHLVSSYFNFLLKSTNQYGVHSPFVYEYITKGLKRGIDDADLKVLADFRRELEQDASVIRVRDFGAGSRVFKGSERQIRQIARTAGISKRRSKMLYKTVAHFHPERILELGTSLGLATAAMSLAAPSVRIDSLEGCPSTAEVAKAKFGQHSLVNINVHIGEFEDTLPRLLSANTYDLIFFDGNHQKEATLKYFERCLDSASESSVFIFDDIHWNPQMEEAWEIIKSHERVTLSIDSFQWGLVFFHKGREKEHFTLRI